jgi:hypothetical protein
VLWHPFRRGINEQESSEGAALFAHAQANNFPVRAAAAPPSVFGSRTQTYHFPPEAMPGGTYTDQAVWNHCGLRNKFLDKEYGIVADKGFTLNPAGMRPIPGANMLKRPRRGELSAKQEQFNLAISQTGVSWWRTLSHNFESGICWRASIAASHLKILKPPSS